jgi:hypothetical protein
MPHELQHAARPFLASLLDPGRRLGVDPGSLGEIHARALE